MTPEKPHRHDTAAGTLLRLPGQADFRIDASGIPAKVESVEYFGADSIVVCRVGDTSGVAVRVGGHLRASAGETLGLSWQDSQQHFFAADSAVINSAGR